MAKNQKLTRKVFLHPAITHINCDKNIDDKTITAINAMVDKALKSSFKTPLTNHIHKNLRYLRKKAGFTLEEMAKICKLKGKSSYNSYETEGVNPKLETCIILSELFKVSIDDLIKKNLPSPPPTKSSITIKLKPEK